MIKILQIREWMEKGVKKKGRWPVKGIPEAPSIIDLFANIPSYLEHLKEEEHYNLHYSIGHWAGDKGKEFEAQEVIPFDIDGMDVERIDEYIPVICNYLKVEPSKVGVVKSGNGLHIIVATTRAITYPEYFEETRHHYKAICGDINATLYEHGLMADCDASLWCTGKSLRLPFTKNIKPDKGEKNCELINGTLVPYDMDITTISTLPVIEVEEQVNLQLLKTSGVDTPAVMGCPFIQNCQVEAETVSEPAWYGMLSIVARLDNGTELAHKISEMHPSYNEADTNNKIEQATTMSGPRTCKNISTLWDGCASCPHWEKIGSPISIKGKNFIKTKDTGFYNMVRGADGITKRGKPNFDDLLLQFKEDHIFRVMNDTIFMFTGTHWAKESHRSYPDVYAESHFDPSPDSKMCTEFRNKLYRHPTAITKATFFETAGLINFKNGWLDPKTGKLSEHSPDMGFMYVLPFKYDPDATCQVFDKFISQVSSKDKEIEQLLVEYAGFVVTAGDSRIDPKALIMVGDGSNGKSVFAELLMAMMGEENYSATSLKDAVTKPEARSNMMGKLLNVSEEVPNNAMVDSSVFKNLVTGGVIESRLLYKDVIRMRNTAKLIMTCNSLPPTRDLSEGMRRRLLIIHFHAVFSRKLGNMDPFILDKLKAELAGVWNRCYTAYKEMRARGGFIEVDSVMQEVEDFITDGSLPITWFKEQGIFEAGNGFATPTDIYQTFRTDMEVEGVPQHKIPAMRECLRELRKHLNLADTVRRRVENKQVRVQFGIQKTGQQPQGEF